ncbi:MAG: hypothetical protein AAF630_07025 [Cyanobacteria bacterium P01_C01_bin.38]
MTQLILHTHLLLKMIDKIKIGSLVKILYPKYVFEFHGIVEAPEDITGRWIVRLINNPFGYSKEPLLLSLEESEIKLITVYSGLKRRWG